MRSPPTLAAVLLALALAAQAPHAAEPSEALSEAARLLRDGRPADALERVERRLAAEPGDAQARFLKGVILAEQARTDEAIDVFVRLTLDRPEFAEPFNNLAVLYGAKGDLPRARAALESAVRANPKYLTALENLGDVYARLAVQAYERAAQIDGRSASVQVKLKLSRELVAGGAAKPPRADALPR